MRFSELKNKNLIMNNERVLKMKKTFRRYVSLLLSIAVCITFLLGAISSSAITENKTKANDANDELSLSLVEKNYVTGAVSTLAFSKEDADEFLETFKFQPAIVGSASRLGNKEINTREIIGTDDRVRVNPTTVYPYSAIAFIRVLWPDFSTTLGTAWMVSNKIAITAAHCIYNSAFGGSPINIEIVPAKNGPFLWNNPYGQTLSCTSSAVSSEYAFNTDSEYDWGIINIGTNYGSQTGTIGYGYYSDNELLNQPVTISGYPGDSDKVYYQYKSTGYISSLYNGHLYYTNDTTGGQSGSPILSSSNIAYGLHTNGGSVYNYGVRFTAYTCYCISQYINLYSQ